DTGNNRIRIAVPGVPRPKSFSNSNGISVAANPAAVSTFAGSGANANTDGTGTAAAFSSPGGLTLSGGFAYVGTAGYLRKMDLSSGAVTTVTGGGPSCANSTVPSQV